jgi:hypothetical protein
LKSTVPGEQGRAEGLGRDGRINSVMTVFWNMRQTNIELGWILEEMIEFYCIIFFWHFFLKNGKLCSKFNFLVLRAILKI